MSSLSDTEIEQHQRDKPAASFFDALTSLIGDVESTKIAASKPSEDLKKRHGFEGSPSAWKAVVRGLEAHRVQQQAALGEVLEDALESLDLVERYEGLANVLKDLQKMAAPRADNKPSLAPEDGQKCVECIQRIIQSLATGHELPSFPDAKAWAPIVKHFWVSMLAAARAELATAYGTPRLPKKWETIVGDDALARIGRDKIARHYQMEIYLKLRGATQSLSQDLSGSKVGQLLAGAEANLRDLRRHQAHEGTHVIRPFGRAHGLDPRSRA
ncbi:hypothetical protein JCM11491_005905 [Sporobolomyces phaffii]